MRILKALALLTITLVSAAPAGVAAATSHDDHANGADMPNNAGTVGAVGGYVCPMPEHPQVYDHPGSCPLCGMELVPLAGRHAVAILLFDDAEVIDFAAPFEVFGQAGYRVFTVAPTIAPVQGVFGMKVAPDYDFAHAPAADILLVPGGGVDLGNSTIVSWVKERAAQAKVVLSVCNGAFWLAKGGLLDGLTATTTSGRIEELRVAAPRTRVVRDRRWVDNGHIVTAAGLSSGIEGALHVVDKLEGHDKARQIALAIEYDWRPESSWTRASLADRYAPHLTLPDALQLHRVSSLGDRDRWRIVSLLTAQETPAAVAGQLAAHIGAAAHWTAAAPPRPAAPAAAIRTWTFRDDDGHPWRATLHVAPASAPGQLQATLEWERAGAPATRSR